MERIDGSPNPRRYAALEVNGTETMFLSGTELAVSLWKAPCYYDWENAAVSKKEIQAQLHQSITGLGFARPALEKPNQSMFPFV